MMIQNIEFFKGGDFLLVYWPEEESTTILQPSAILEPTMSQLQVGTMCVVKFGRKEYCGQLAGIGKFFGTLHMCCTVHGDIHAIILHFYFYCYQHNG